MLLFSPVVWLMLHPHYYILLLKLITIAMVTPALHLTPASKSDICGNVASPVLFWLFCVFVWMNRNSHHSQNWKVIPVITFPSPHSSPDGWRYYHVWGSVVAAAGKRRRGGGGWSVGTRSGNEEPDGALTHSSWTRVWLWGGSSLECDYQPNEVFSFILCLDSVVSRSGSVQPSALLQSEHHVSPHSVDNR